MGEPPERIPETAATAIGVDTVRRVVLQQSRYWKCLYPKGGSKPSQKKKVVADLLQVS